MYTGNYSRKVPPMHWEIDSICSYWKIWIFKILNSFHWNLHCNITVDNRLFPVRIYVRHAVICWYFLSNILLFMNIFQYSIPTIWKNNKEGGIVENFKCFLSKAWVKSSNCFLFSSGYCTVYCTVHHIKNKYFPIS